MKAKKNFSVIIAVVVILGLIVLAPKGSGNLSTAGGGISLKDLNQKDTTTTSLSADIELNQTTEQTLAQSVLIGDYFRRSNGFYYGGGFIGIVSTEFNVCIPTMFVRTGVDFNTFQLECKAGNFDRNALCLIGVDPQFSNYCIVNGQGASANNAVQLSFINKNTTISIGHSGVENFYTFDDGTWYACMSQKFGDFTLNSGVDLGDETTKTTGFAAARWQSKDNTLTLQANQLGTENKNFALSYNRNNISVGKQLLSLTGTVWTMSSEHGGNLIAGLKKGKSTLFTEVGSKLCSGKFTPYCGVGTVYIF